MKRITIIIVKLTVPGRTGKINSFPEKPSAESAMRPLICHDDHLLHDAATNPRNDLDVNVTIAAAPITKKQTGSRWYGWFPEPCIKPGESETGNKNPFAAGKERGGMPME